MNILLQVDDKNGPVDITYGDILNQDAKKRP